MNKEWTVESAIDFLRKANVGVMIAVRVDGGHIKLLSNSSYFYDNTFSGCRFSDKNAVTFTLPEGSFSFTSSGDKND